MTYYQNDPIAARREVVVKLVTPGGATASGVSGTTIMVAQPGGNFASHTGDVTEKTGGGESLYVFTLAQSEQANVGRVEYTVAKTGTIAVCSGYVDVERWDGAYLGSISAVGSTSSITFDTNAPAIDSFFRTCLLTFQSGALAGQSALVAAYTSGRIATLSPALTALPSIGDAFDLQPTAGLDAAAVWSWVLDSLAPTGAQTAQELMLIIAAYAAGNATGLPPTLSGTQAFKSFDGTKTRVAGTIANGVRTITTRNGD